MFVGDLYGWIKVNYKCTSTQWGETLSINCAFEIFVLVVVLLVWSDKVTTSHLSLPVIYPGQGNASSSHLGSCRGNIVNLAIARANVRIKVSSWTFLWTLDPANHCRHSDLCRPIRIENRIGPRNKACARCAVPCLRSAIPWPHAWPTVGGQTSWWQYFDCAQRGLDTKSWEKVTTCVELAYAWVWISAHLWCWISA